MEQYYDEELGRLIDPYEKAALSRSQFQFEKPKFEETLPKTTGADKAGMAKAGAESLARGGGLLETAGSIGLASGTGVGMGIGAAALTMAAIQKQKEQQRLNEYNKDLMKYQKELEIAKMMA